MDQKTGLVTSGFVTNTVLVFFRTRVLTTFCRQMFSFLEVKAIVRIKFHTSIVLFNGRPRQVISNYKFHA